MRGINRSIYGSVLVSVYLFLFFLTFNQGVFKVSFLKYIDEITLVLSVGVILLVTLKEIYTGVVNKIFLVLAIYVICQYFNYLNSPFDLNLNFVLIQSFINIKIFVVSLAFVILIRKINISNKYYFFYYCFVVLFLLGLLLNLVLGEEWNKILGYKVEYRYGFLRPAGWFSDVGQNVYFFVLFFSTLFFLYFKKQLVNVKGVMKKFFIFLVIDFFLAFVLTARKGLLFMISLFYLGFKEARLEFRAIFVMLSVLFIVAFIKLISGTQMYSDSLENISNFFHDEHGYVRGLVFFYGVSLFVEFFPFGVGAGTYGTVMSQYNTLAVYEYVGMPESIYIHDGVFKDKTAIYDSGLASIMAENGFIGVVFLGAFVFFFFRFNKKILDAYNYTVFCLITWFTLLLSVIDPVFQNGMYTVFYAMNLLMLYGRNNMVKMNRRWVKARSYSK